jgi:hypothetical protein
MAGGKGDSGAIGGWACGRTTLGCVLLLRRAGALAGVDRMAGKEREGCKPRHDRLWWLSHTCVDKRSHRQPLEGRETRDIPPEKRTLMALEMNRHDQPDRMYTDAVCQLGGGARLASPFRNTFIYLC